MAEPQKIRRKQLFGLLLCSLLTIMYAGPLLRLLPVHASQMGASPSQVGMYLALVYTGLVAGTLAAGWLSDRFQRRKATIILAGLLASLGLALMSRSGTLWQLSIFTACTWLFGGIAYTMFMILAGIFAGDDERGKVFGMLAMTMPLANFLAAPVAGTVADRWGYPVLLGGYAIFTLSIPVVALVLDDRKVAKPMQGSAGEDRELGRRHWFSMGFCLLINATFIMAFVGFVNQLGLSLTMYSQAYSSTDIAMAVAFAALVSIPLIVLFGWLSDRYPRWRLLVACFVAAGTGTLVLARASVLWQFWLASMLVAVLAASDSLSNALATDLMPMDRVGQGVSITNAVRWMGAVAGLGVAGIAIETWGSQRALLVVLCLVPVATVMATQIRPDLSPTRKVLAS